jgi:hypothetical protein
MTVLSHMIELSTSRMSARTASALLPCSKQYEGCYVFTSHKGHFSLKQLVAFL